MTRLPRLAALAVVPQDGHLLLVRRRNPPDAGLWGFPGGHVDWGETAARAAVRELFEETGVRAEPQRLLTNLDIIVPGPDGTPAHHFLLVATLCAYRSGRPAPADDVTDAAWVPFDDVLSGALPLSRDVDTLLRLALD